MNSVRRATIEDCKLIVRLGKRSVTYAHRDSCPPEILKGYIEPNYNDRAITNDVSDKRNLYHIIENEGEPVGFSKMVLNQKQADIHQQPVAKLDRIYVLREYYGRKLGYELFTFNANLARENGQQGIWLDG